ncbi:MAG: hydroxymethylpyrimidine/phosphomethylpyrimidine kinase [Candidatus Dactylopiibacterium carminicum]|uniref:Hydroxymethylpyrimidine/phosphomethylpyrimidine kinase n=1 Tax=Candidatus Dactylopiibacterium carminicum TaxID=857335 RepID=A0A272EVN6_9RHOO|nr:hydroxymethylpyrimidine/phosphomethylpyrimidine kinase [Candidatus Dactylopiibacterium carminicum]PAS94116.1 MAG: hydroxymethylpyrimidine/phosphomethylpyrimidine kinase [Candidatus Dactylopiibacterium carminicum]PAS98221.1 MAG: hydroxymethylpyrimidine/phosphomethylpyrimidine kinase [Candidatus Dactylopiibacterium carminicum]
MSFGCNDPTSAIGLGGDALTLSALGVYPLSVSTGLLVQDTSRTESFFATDGDWVADQARALLEDIPVSCFKLGQFASTDNVAEVADVLADYPDIPVVYAPDLTLHGSDAETEEDMLGSICELILPLCQIVICGPEDAARLAPDDDSVDEGEAEPEDAPPAYPAGHADSARLLLAYGAGHVLLTGAHAQSPQIVNTLFGQQGMLRTDSWERLPGSHLGGNDLLAAALAAFIAQGSSLEEAVGLAQRYAWHAQAQGWRLGMGRIVPNHFCDWKSA